MLGDNIRLLRSVRGISQVELGEKLNVSKQSISNWENGNIQPSIEMLMKIADFFSVSTDFLLGLDNRTSIIVDGLSTEELSHIRVIIDDLVAAKRRMGIEQNDDRPREKPEHHPLPCNFGTDDVPAVLKKFFIVLVPIRHSITDYAFPFASTVSRYSLRPFS